MRCSLSFMALYFSAACCVRAAEVDDANPPPPLPLVAGCMVTKKGCSCFAANGLPVDQEANICESLQRKKPALSASQLPDEKGPKKYTDSDIHLVEWASRHNQKPAAALAPPRLVLR
jgi:hypothetical protein